jgi:hypothetical protein
MVNTVAQYKEPENMKLNHFRFSHLSIVVLSYTLALHFTGISAEASIPHCVTVFNDLTSSFDTGTNQTSAGQNIAELQKDIKSVAAKIVEQWKQGRIGSEPSPVVTAVEIMTSSLRIDSDGLRKIFASHKITAEMLLLMALRTEITDLEQINTGRSPIREKVPDLDKVVSSQIKLEISITENTEESGTKKVIRVMVSKLDQASGPKVDSATTETAVHILALVQDYIAKGPLSAAATELTLVYPGHVIEVMEAMLDAATPRSPYPATYHREEVRFEQIYRAIVAMLPSSIIMSEVRNDGHAQALKGFLDTTLISRVERPE